MNPSFKVAIASLTFVIIYSVATVYWYRTGRVGSRPLSWTRVDNPITFWVTVACGALFSIGCLGVFAHALGQIVGLWR